MEGGGWREGDGGRGRREGGGHCSVRPCTYCCLPGHVTKDLTMNMLNTVSRGGPRGSP